MVFSINAWNSLSQSHARAVIPPLHSVFSLLHQALRQYSTVGAITPGLTF